MAKFYKYPDPDEMQINELALRTKFREYRDALKKDPSLLDLFLIVPAWVPVFFSRFNDFHGIPGSDLKASYATLVGIATLRWLGNNRQIILLFRKYRTWRGADVSSSDLEVNPDKKVDAIKKECDDDDRKVKSK